MNSNNHRTCLVHSMICEKKNSLPLSAGGCVWKQHFHAVEEMWSHNIRFGQFLFSFHR